MLDMAALDGAAVERLTHAVARLPSDIAVDLAIATPLWRMDEHHASPEAALRRLQALRSLLELPAGVVIPHPHVSRQVDPGEDLGNAVLSAFRGIEANRFMLTGEVIRGLDRLGLWQRSIVLSFDPASEALSYRFIGDVHSRRFGRWARDAIGRPSTFGDAANPNYSQWVSRTYHLVFESGTPTRHVIDCLIRDRRFAKLPDRTNYDRLLVPVGLLNGQRGLLLVSEVTPGLLPLAPCSALDPEAARSASSKRGPS